MRISYCRYTSRIKTNDLSLKNISNVLHQKKKKCEIKERGWVKPFRLAVNDVKIANIRKRIGT